MGMARRSSAPARSGRAPTSVASRELALILAGEPDVDQRAGDERRRGARHALEDLGEIRPRAGRFRPAR